MAKGDKETGKQVGFRLKADVYARLADAAATRGLSVGHYVRDLVVNAMDGRVDAQPVIVAASRPPVPDEALARLEQLADQLAEMQQRSRTALEALLVAAGKTEAEEASAFCDALFGKS